MTKLEKIKQNKLKKTWGKVGKKLKRSWKKLGEKVEKKNEKKSEKNTIPLSVFPSYNIGERPACKLGK